MVVDGSRHTVESRPQVTNSGDRPKKDGPSTNGFSPLLFLILSVPVPPNNAAISDKGQVAGLNQAAPLADSQLSIESMHSDGSAICGENGVQAEDQRGAPNAEFSLITDSAPSYPGALSDRPLAAETKPNRNDGPSSVFQSVTGRDEISNSRVAGEAPATANFVPSHPGVWSDKPLATDSNAKPSDRLCGIFQPVTDGNEEPGPAQNPGPNISVEQTAAASEAAQAGVPRMRPSEVVDTPDGASHLRNTGVGDDQKQLLIALDPAVGKARKVSVAAVEEVSGKSEVQSGKEIVRDLVVAKDNPDGVGADSANDHSQNTLETKEEQQRYSGSSVSAKTSNGEFNILVGDKAPHETSEMSRDGAQRSNETATFIVRPTVLPEAASAAADVPANSWRPVVERVAGEMAGRIKLNKQDAIIQLDPPELGKIKIDLHVDGDKLQARILTQGHESQALIENHLQELRQALQANNLDLVDVRVQGGWHGASGDAMHGFPQPQQQQQQTGSQQEWSWASGNIADRNAVEAQPSTALTPDKGRVSMWA